MKTKPYQKPYPDTSQNTKNNKKNKNSPLNWKIKSHAKVSTINTLALLRNVFGAFYHFWCQKLMRCHYAVYA